MANLSAKKWLSVFCISALVFGVGVLGVTVYVDPKFYYHGPNPRFYYTLESEEGMNPGIERYFDYDAIITGSCMSDCFLTSQAGELFGYDFIKVENRGGGFDTSRREVDNAFRSHDDIKLVICSLDMNFFAEDTTKEFSFENLKEELAEKRPFLDVTYLLNRDVLFNRCVPMIRNAIAGEPGGVSSFDDYGYWIDFHPYLLDVDPDFTPYKKSAKLSDEDRALIRDNVGRNIVDLVNAHPDTEFYYFITPYSGVWWGYLFRGYGIENMADFPSDPANKKSNFNRFLEEEEMVMEMLLECPNLKLFSYNDRFNLITDLYNYVDEEHYNADVSKDLLEWMKNGEGLVTKENYKEKIEKERDFYGNFDYKSMYETKEAGE